MIIWGGANPSLFLSYLFAASMFLGVSHIKFYDSVSFIIILSNLLICLFILFVLFCFRVPILIELIFYPNLAP